MRRIDQARKAILLFALVLGAPAARGLAETPGKESAAGGAKNDPRFDALHAAKLEAIEARVAHAQAHLALLEKESQQQRHLEAAELSLELALRNRKKYLKGEAARRRAALAAEVLLAKQRSEQQARRVEWSVRLANEGLISQAELELDQAALMGQQAALKAARDRLQVFESSSHPRSKLEADAEVAAAEAEQEALQQLAAAAQREGKTIERLTREAQQEAVDRIELLTIDKEEMVAKTEAVKNEAMLVLAAWQAQKRTAQLARAAFRRAEIEAKVRSRRRGGHVGQGEQQLAAARLRLEEFLKIEKASRINAAQEKIRAIAETLSKARQQLAWSQRVVRKRYITRSQLKVDELAVLQHQAAWEDARHELKILQQHILPSQEYQLRTKVAHAERELARRKQLAAVRVEEATVVTAARREAWRLQQQRLEHLAGQLPGGKTMSAAGGGG